MLVGGCCIDDADRLRSGSGVGVLGFAPAAASTLGTFLRSFTFGHLRQFDRFHELALGRAWSVGHAVVELAIRDLKEGSELDHVPSGHYGANCAWLACAVLAHNIGHWTALLVGAQAELWPNWRHHAFITDRDDLDTKEADAYHRAHATVELAIRDLKEGSGLSRCPSRRFFANGAWLACCVLAHNLARWTARLGRTHPTRQLTVAATIRNRLLTVPGRLVNHSGRHRLGGFKWSSQHLDVEVCDGRQFGVVGDADGETGDEVAGASADSSGCGAGVLGEDRRGAHKRGRGDRVWGVGFRRIPHHTQRPASPSRTLRLNDTTRN